MKQYFLPLLALLLVGQGCLGGTSGTDNARLTPEADQSISDTGMMEDMMVEDESLLGDMMDEREEEMEEQMEEMMEDDDDEGVTEMRAGNFFFEPNAMTATVGEEVAIRFSEVTGVHTFVIDELGVKESVVDGRTIRFTPTSAGTFEFYCDIGNHRAMGMTGVLTVVE